MVTATLPAKVPQTGQKRANQALQTLSELTWVVWTSPKTVSIWIDRQFSRATRDMALMALSF